jgi:SET domain-containing protein
MRFWTKSWQLFTKPAIQQPKGTEIKKSPLHGQGIFAKKEFRSGRIIEISPIVLLSQQEKDLLRHTLLFAYYFVIDHPVHAIAVGLGASSMFNHSYAANAEYSIAIEDQAITIRARKLIRKGEEITLNYNGHPEGSTPVYFPPELTEFKEYPEFPGLDEHKKQLYLKIIPGKSRSVPCWSCLHKITQPSATHI